MTTERAEWIVSWAQLRQKIEKCSKDLLSSLRMAEAKTEQETKREVIIYFINVIKFKLVFR